MKCVDCLPLLEEFFDGEVDDKTGGRVRGHLAACAECAEAFDALRAEQEMFLRYDRGLEVTPALWHGVREAITAAEMPEPKPKPRPFLAGLREQLAAALAVFAARPALASSMALLALGVTAGALWFSNSGRQSATTPNRIADSNGGVRPAPPSATNDTTNTTTNDKTNTTSTRTPTVAAQLDNVAPAKGDKRGASGRNFLALAETFASWSSTKNRRGATGGGGVVNFNGAPSGSGVVTFVDAGHGAAAEDALPTVARASLVEANLADAAAVLDPEDEAVSRHVERAQMLLRSIKNTSAADGGDDLAYERELSRKLLEENFSLRLDADADNNKKAQKVLKELEPYLNDIANLRDRPARGELRSIKERMEKQEIIAALHVYDD